MGPVSLVRLFVVTLVGIGLMGPVATSVAAQPAGGGSYIVVLRDDVADPAAVANEMAQRHGLGLTNVYQFAIKGFAAEVPAAAVEGIARDPRVAFIESDQVAYAFDVPTGVDRIEVDKKLGFSSSPASVAIGVDIAIIDTGIAPHGDLNIAGGANCSGGSPFKASCTEGNPGDDNGHGTHVAGTAAANGGVVGVAPGARLYGVKVLRADGSGYMSWIVAGIDWVTARADVIDVANMSLGCECSSAAMDTALTNSTNAGVTYVVAAGNSAADAATFSPANHPQVIAVSAMADFNGRAGGGAAPTCRSDVDETFADFSNYGSVVDIAAPGVCILSTWNDGSYNTISGTSMASPHAAGAAALYIVENGRVDWSAVRTGLQSSGWSVAQIDPCAYSEGRSPERFLMLAACDSATTDSDAAPTVSVVAPTDASTVSGMVLVQVAASDEEDAVGSLTVTYAIDDSTTVVALAYNTASEYYEATWDTTTVGDGRHTLTAQATDSAGQTTSAVISVAVDNVVDDAPVTEELAAPTGLSATAAPRGKPTVTLTWTDNAENETEYHVYRSEVGDFYLLVTLPALEGTGTMEYKDQQVSRGTSYAYCVAAFNETVGESAWVCTSEPVTASAGSAVPTDGASDSQTSETGFAEGSTVVTTDAVNLRADASQRATVVTELPAGTSLTVTGAANQAQGISWVPVVTADGLRGYVATDFLTAG